LVFEAAAISFRRRPEPVPALVGAEPETIGADAQPSSADPAPADDDGELTGVMERPSGSVPGGSTLT
jgi:hypothetical protein